MDYFGIFLSGFSTGLGVIVAQKAYKYWEKVTENNKHILKRIFIGSDNEGST